MAIELLNGIVGEKDCAMSATLNVTNMMKRNGTDVLCFFQVAF